MIPAVNGGIILPGSRWWRDAPEQFCHVGSRVGRRTLKPSGSAPSGDLLVNLIAFWDLEEASGTRADSHGSNDLADNNTVSQSAGKIGNAASFSRASSEWLDITDNADLSVGDIDFEFNFWLNVNSAANSTHSLISKWASYPSNVEYAIQWVHLSNGPRSVETYVYNTGLGSLSTVGLGWFETNTWHNVSIWHDSVNNLLGIRVDDTNQNTAAYSGGVRDGTSPFELGRNLANGQYLNGLLDSVGFWKRLLTSTERTWLYNSGNGRSYADIAAF